MSGSLSGALLGATVALGCWLVAARWAALRRVDLDTRVVRHLPDLPHVASLSTDPSGNLGQVFGPLLRSAAVRIERVLGGAASVRRRLDRAGLDLTLHDFRIQQATWGLVGFAVSAGLAVAVALRAPDRVLPLAALVAVATVAGVLLRENRLTAQVRRHEQQVLEELPAVAELLALAVAAGEGPVTALERVVRRSRGAFSRDLGRVLAEIRTGRPVAGAFDALSARTGLPVVSRFAHTLAVAIERGTPLTDVLHAQAGDVREARRRALIENGARREVAMMVPVVFLVLPTTVLFAFWPGVVGLRLVT